MLSEFSHSKAAAHSSAQSDLNKACACQDCSLSVMAITDGFIYFRVCLGQKSGKNPCCTVW